MSVQAKVLLSAAALLGAVFLWRGMRSQERAPLQGSLVQRAVLEDSLLALPMQEQEVALPGPESMVGERVAAPPVSASSVPSAAQAASEIKSLKGRVIDMQGRGVEGLQVVLRAFTHRRGAKGPRGEHDPHGIAAPAPGPIARPASNSVLSASNGAFELEVEGPAWVEVASESHTTLMSSFGSPGDTDLIVVVAACMRLGGQVVDRGTGEPLERARLMLINGELAFSELGLNEEQTSRASISTETGADGRFVLSNAAYVKNSFLVAQCAGYVDLVQPLPTEASVELRFELVARSGPDVIRGLVRLPDGRPAEGALVACGGFAVEADAAGRFTLQASQAPEGRVDPTQAIVVHGVLAGFGPALRELPPLEGASSEPWPEEIVLQLSKERSGLRGHVRDQNGKGLQGILVGIQRPTDFGLVRDGDSLTSSTLRSVEDLLNPGLDDLRTDADGAFEIHNLMQRSYELEAFDPGSGCVSASLAYPAGTSGIDLRLDTSLVGRLAGHVVTRAGSPVAGIRMVLVRAQKGRNFRMGQSCVTDEEGRFALQGAALEEVGLSISGPTVQFEIFRALPEGQDREQLEIVVSLRCHAQFEWESWSTQGARLSIVGAGDLPVELSTRTAEYISVQADAPIYGALSPVFVLPDSASAAVIKLDGLEIGRVPLKLVPGDVQRVKL